MGKFITIIRPDFMQFCGDACRAAALNHLLFRIAGKSKDQPKEKIQSGDILWYAKTEQITEEMSNAWGVCKVRKEVNALINMGIIGKRVNPAWGADRTKHFSFGQDQCKIFTELCEKNAICIVHIGLPPEVMHLIYSSNANDTSIKCICVNHQMETIEISNANDTYIGAIPIDRPTIDDYKDDYKDEGTFVGSSDEEADVPTPINLQEEKKKRGDTDPRLKAMPKGQTNNELLTPTTYSPSTNTSVTPGDLPAADLGSHTGDREVARRPGAAETKASQALGRVDTAEQQTVLLSPSGPLARVSPVNGGKPGAGAKDKKVTQAKSDTREVQRRIDEHRGYSLEEKGQIMQERIAIKSWCNLHTIEEYEQVMQYLTTKDKYWKLEDNKYRIGGVTLAKETPKALAQPKPKEKNGPAAGGYYFIGEAM